MQIGAWIALGVAVLLFPELALGQASPPNPGRAGYWSEPRIGDPLDIALDRLRRDGSRLGLSRADLDGVEVLDRFRARRTGLGPHPRR